MDKYNLIKAILASNLGEDVKEALVNNLIGQPQPFYVPCTITYSQDTHGANSACYRTYRG